MPLPLCSLFLLWFLLLRIDNTVFSLQLPYPPVVGGGKGLCMMESYAMVRGPYLTALLDQLWDQTVTSTTKSMRRSVVFCTLASYQEKCEELRQQWQNDQQEWIIHQEEQQQQVEDDSWILTLDDYNPLLLEQESRLWQPKENAATTGNNTDSSGSSQMIIWLVGPPSLVNALEYRYKLRTSGFDSYLERVFLNGRGDGPLLVTEGAGAWCLGSNVGMATALQSVYPIQDPSQVPEPQFYGLVLLGDKKSVVFGDETVHERLTTHPKTTDDVEKEHLVLLDPDQVVVWSASKNQEDHASDTTTISSFTYRPSMRGMIENWDQQDVQQEQITRTPQQQREGVDCIGEPSIDPSRSMQNSVGVDSEWMPDYNDSQ